MAGVMHKPSKVMHSQQRSCTLIHRPIIRRSHGRCENVVALPARICVQIRKERTMFNPYRVCEVCGSVVDEWGYYVEQINGVEQSFFVCFDCEDSFTPEEIIEFVSEFRKRFGGYRTVPVQSN